SYEYRRALVTRFVEYKRRVRFAVRQVAPIVKNKLSKPRALDAFQKLLGNDLIRIDVGTIERSHEPGVFVKSFHLVFKPQIFADERGSDPRSSAKSAAYLNSHSRTSVKCPLIAAAAAIIGLTRCVRPPRPWRPSKFLLLVDAQRSPGLRTSAFIPKHIEHPASRHSNPASLKIRSRPSCSAARFTSCD